MGSESEPAKLLLPFLQRADELQKHEPLVAYYCRLYAMERGLKIPQKDRTKTTNSLLISLINQLEKDKKSIKSGPDDYLYVEGFASSVFAKADKQDRAGRADLNTAKTFYAASIFFEILSQFGELQPDIEQKFKYAVWKAADIRKALKEGRKPEPGPPGGDKDLSVPSSPPSSTYDVGHNENFSSTHPTPSAGAATHHEEKDMRRSDSFQTNSPGADISSEPLGRSYSYIASQPPASSPDTYPTDYPPGDHHQHPPSNTQDIPGYPQTYHSQSYPDDQPFSSPKLHPENPQNYHPEMPPPPYSYPNFQSYPSFHETTFPAAPTHQPSYYHSPDSSSYSNQTSAGPSVSSYAPPTVKYDYGSGSVNHVATPAPPTTVASASPPAYTYDSNYLPPVEMITEAHKAARFAVGALAFDDVPVAVEFLRKSLELLTNPKAETH